MRILLDTSYIYDLATEHWSFSDAERSILSDRNTRFYVSAVSIWEMRIKFNSRRYSGRRKSELNPEHVVRLLVEHGLSFLPMTPGHAACPLEVPITHKDPFDELLLVQAQQENLRFLTKDRLMSEHPLVIGMYLRNV